MLKIKVEDFSCIIEAEVVVDRLTVIIGPQASGKSILSKLVYFFLDLVSDQYEFVAKQTTFDGWSDEIKSKFSDWFPVSAWGRGKFKITFEMGDYKMRLTRTSYDDSIKNNLRLWTSPMVKEHYRFASDASKRLKTHATGKSDELIADYEVAYDMRTAARRHLMTLVGDDYVSSQTFIPAGRSFFTTLGRMFFAFDQGRTLDPIHVHFGRLYAAYQEELRYFSSRRRTTGVDFALGKLLGGEIFWDGDRPALNSLDGRKVPFSALSSGQQELIPLVMAIARHTRVQKQGASSALMFIEEPEAHLFPSAQSHLIERLASLVGLSNGVRRLAITTHSPYVLSKINNLIYAGQLQAVATQAMSAELDLVVPKENRIAPGHVSAYAIIDGIVVDIKDDSGLIDARYIDDVSGDIGGEFNQLMDIEAMIGD